MFARLDPYEEFPPEHVMNNVGHFEICEPRRDHRDTGAYNKSAAAAAASATTL
jgi:hypothetical protein